jgi:hypothetical protein
MDNEAEQWAKRENSADSVEELRVDEWLEYMFDPGIGLFERSLGEAIVAEALDAVEAWGLSREQAEFLAGIGPSPKQPVEVSARVTLIVAIRREMEIAFKQPRADEVMRAPNSGLLSRGLSPIGYILRNDWAGMFFLMIQAQRWANE